MEIALSAMETLRGAAPAKLNLFLHVVGRRADGYHLLQSVFRLLDWGDEVILRARDDGRIRRTSELVGVPEAEDLVVRAGRALQQASKCRLGADLSVIKRLPMGGGLGGGSSDAATTLLGLNRLWGLGYSRRELVEIGLSLGADVPFFLFGQDAFVEGVGELMQPVSLAPAWYVIVFPNVSVPTAEIFSARELTRNTQLIKIADFALNATRNDLEAVACNRFPEIKGAISWLGRYHPARMTGSGACVFAEVPSESEAKKIVGACPSSWKAWCARSSGFHPLHDWVSDDQL
ncbi:MAG: 4-(cytidine 5'-diphospho)-2-C-methyl-D-erythritol kinase [Zoogloeaceae bacterium]|nr:4-(cytidine 5'-diphospho)-2-C-methyl-D-erythritol kinase [Rhodocyclaceae bacterium]MCP5238218.1 4-(cytidine 5'-diphospho)-2-C-methyl-D-erythritol kinase [Zoogloeaceae bacterium]MCP5255411.1 4-(cytidine 5'-diphospho)-2-C-methyl-D-erythritol kinase [Zoogloeaceae bacterium]MCP5294565.1 4-(cytidine 5'-diphospho)-2-C-methyl-D-erythritol kinase [Zoogloeaceae bacterium]